MDSALQRSLLRLLISGASLLNPASSNKIPDAVGGEYSDRRGRRYGKLLVTSISYKDKRGVAVVHAKCNCGKSCVVVCKDLVAGQIKSCGCSKD